MINSLEARPTLKGTVACLGECLQERIQSDIECRTDFQYNRTEYLNCSAENALHFNTCLSECSVESAPPTHEEPKVSRSPCAFRCTREQLRCQGLCRRHPFMYEWDRTQCILECDFDYEQCQEICVENEGKDPQT
jgi:hypothetical protein